MIEIIVLFS